MAKTGFWLKGAIGKFDNKKRLIYFVLSSLIRNFDLRSNLLPLENTKKKQVFLWYCPRLFVTLQKETVIGII